MHDFNEQKLLQISDTPTITIRSHDLLSEQGKRKLHIPENRLLTGGLHSVLRLAGRARVSIVNNMDISDGLVNGANGSISAIRLNKDHPLDGVIMVKFEKEQIGKSARSTLPLSLQSEGVPITVTTSRFFWAVSLQLLLIEPSIHSLLRWLQQSIKCKESLYIRFHCHLKGLDLLLARHMLG